MASRYPAAWLETLRDRSDIVQTVSGYVSLKKNGKKYWGLCPFHGEKTASFSVDEEKQLYYCFGCKAGGTVINFIMDIERLTFPEAVELLAERAHMPMPEMERDEEYERRRTQRERLLAANKAAARFYHETLFTPKGAASLEYLKKRGLSDGIIRKFGLGAAPSGWDTVTVLLQEQGFSLDELRLAGLTVIKDAEPATAEHPAKPRRAFDMFRDRAMFPIIDQYGNVLAFGGRILGKGEPKYLNTSDTPVFNKRKGVFAANLLRKERHLERVILTEGYMDVISLTQFGVRGVCATLGTALTNEQARLLRRFAPQVYLSYDGDAAGQHAILRGLDILKEENMPARVLDFPDGLDPDEFIRRDGAEGFAALPALSPETYRMRRLRDEMDLSTDDGKVAYARACAKIIAPLDPVAREGHLRDLSVQTGFSREVLQAQLNLTPVPEPAGQEPLRPPRPTVKKPRQTEQEFLRSSSENAQETLLGLFASGQLPEDLVMEEDFPDPELKLIYRDLRSGVSGSAIIERAPDEESRSRLTRILLSPLSEETDVMIRMAHECVAKIRADAMRERMKQIEAQMKDCADAPRRAALIAEYMDLTRKVQPGRPE